MSLLAWWPFSLHLQAEAAPDRRPQLAAAMCWWCRRRWLAGRSILHRGCAEDLAEAIEAYFQRRRDGR